MSITTTPVLDHPVLTALDAVVDGVSPVNTPGAIEWWRFTDTERLTVVTRILEVRASVDALVAQAVGCLDRDGVTEREACIRTATWLRSTNHLSLGAARREVTAGRALTGRFTATADALAAGEISAEQAQAIVRALDELPPELSDAQVHAGEASLLGYARTLGPPDSSDSRGACSTCCVPNSLKSRTPNGWRSNAKKPNAPVPADGQRRPRRHLRTVQTRCRRRGSDPGDHRRHRPPRPHRRRHHHERR